MIKSKDFELYVDTRGSNKKPWIDVTCWNPECGKMFTISGTAYRRRMKASKSGKIFCTNRCSNIHRHSTMNVDVGCFLCAGQKGGGLVCNDHLDQYLRNLRAMSGA